MWQVLACTRSLHVHRRCFIFLLDLFENIGERENECGASIFFFPPPYHPALAVNKSPAVFIFYHARSTDFEEKVEGL